MLKLKRSSVLLIVVMGLLATSGIALAGHVDSHAEDTQFSFGYDNANHILSLNIGPNWEPYVCDFENGALTVGYDAPNVDTGVILIDTLEDSGGVKTFASRDAGDLRPPTAHAGDGPTPYASDPDGVCGLSGVVVAGPNGQINHGQFIKAAKSLFDIKGQGCVVRYLAQSEIGRTDDTRVRVSDVPDSIPPIVDDVLVIFSEAFQADCDRGKKNGDGEAESTRGGRPEFPGKSGDAPGHANKP